LPPEWRRKAIEKTPKTAENPKKVRFKIVKRLSNINKIADKRLRRKVKKQGNPQV